MSSSCKSKPRCFGSDIHRLLLAAEAGQKADILTYSSGHLGPRSLTQSQPHRETKQSFWRMSQSQEETPLTLQQTRTKPRAFSQKKSNSSSDPEGKQQVCSTHSDQEGPNNEGQLKTKQRFGRQVIAKQDLWAGINVAEMHERKLQKELKKLSAQSWPSRDRLVVFSDVFDDVCEGSPVFGRILREIKTDYDLYVNHMMASQSSLHDMSQNTSHEDLGNGKVREMELEDAEKEVCRLEQEARRALEENIRVRNELQNVPAIINPEDIDMKNASLSRLQDRGTAIGCTNCVQSKRLQVLNTWREIQQLEEEIKEKLVSTVTTTANERRIKDLKTEIMRLIASNDRLKTTNKDLRNNINMVLNREKASKAIRRMLWDEAHCDLQTE
ncbi:uncharacterized protein C6orf118-like isoform X5 [Siniperca chuatsi]|uniref:uncharacterized protein C6orf118-like isoform X5 n=1 Tax=Siniperca chuatsi TaxID=119488 RepID=UPI001CE04CBE|nr:uncharacterized protein C6orf118-like isoform X5 [Siniperca chuatsi]